MRALRLLEDSYYQEFLRKGAAGKCWSKPVGLEPHGAHKDLLVAIKTRDPGEMETVGFCPYAGYSYAVQREIVDGIPRSVWKRSAGSGAA